MPQQRARGSGGDTRDSGTASARESLEHLHILFRFHKDPLDAAMLTRLPPGSAKPPTRPPPKRPAK